MVAALALIVFAVSFQQLWTRVVRANEQSPPTLYYFKPVNQSEFIFAASPVVIEDDVADDGTGTVTIHYGDDELILPIAIPVRYDLPNLAGHTDWMRILLLKENEGFDRQRARADRQAGIADARCIIVTRHQRPGTNPETFGEVFKSDWQFSFYELNPSGGIDTLPRLVYPESDRALSRRQSRARRDNKPIPQRKQNEIEAGTWQFQAAMWVMPTGGAPKGLPPRPSLEALSWTLPLASVSLVVAVFCIAMAFAPRREDVNK